MKKIMAIGGGVVAFLLIVVLVGGLVLSCQIESIVEEGIEREGSKIVGTPVTVGSVELSLLSGEGTINDLAVGNPDGFDTPHMLDIGGASVHLDPWSVLDGEAPVDIHSVELNDATVTVEAYLLGMKTNVMAIKNNISSNRADRGGADDEGGEDEGAPSKAAQRKLRIKRLSLKNTRVHVVFHGPGRERERSIGLTDFELRDLGGDDGAPPREIAKQIFTEVATRARAAMFRMPGPWQKLRNKLLKNLDGQGLDRLQKAGTELLDALQGGTPVRDLRDAWQQNRLDSGDGGPGRESPDGGGNEDQPELGKRIKALRESIRNAREGRSRAKMLESVRGEPEGPR